MLYRLFYVLSIVLNKEIGLKLLSHRLELASYTLEWKIEVDSRPQC